MLIAITDLHDRRPPRFERVEGGATIGADPRCTIVLDGPGIGALHARLAPGGHGFTIEHVGGRVPTLLDGVPISGRGAVSASREATITIGDAVLRLVSARNDHVLGGERRAGGRSAASGVEASLLDALRAHPADHDTRLVYADWLEERGRTAEAVVIRHAAAGTPLDAAARVLAPGLDLAWRATVWCGPIEQCPMGEHAGSSPAPARACPGRWEHLALGPLATWRSCRTCGDEVEFVHHVDMLRMRSSRVRLPLTLCPSLERAQAMAELARPMPYRGPGVVVGRPARVGGAPRVAEVASRGEWSARVAPAPPPDEATRRAAAEAWLHAARDEHASIAAFGALSLQLLALGAPPELLADCHAAALDEIRHARLCFELASRYAGRALGPAAFGDAPRVGGPTTREALARETFADGCVNETIAALEARRAAAHAEPALAAVLAGIADDEERHAELAWRIVAWCLGDAAPRAAGDLAGLAGPAAEVPAAEDDPALLACGILGPRGRALARAEGLARVAARVATSAR